MNIGFVRRWLAAVPGLLLPLSAAQAQASFDCNQAARVVDRIICSWGPAAAADRTLAARYQAALAAAASRRDALREEQRQWLKERDRRCVGDLPAAQLAGVQPSPAYLAAARCLEQAYAQRIAALQDQATPALVPLAVETLPRAVLQAARQDLSGRDAAWEAAAISPDGSMLGLNGGGRIWLYRRDQPRLSALTPPPPARGAPSSRDDVSGLEGLRWGGDNSLYAWVWLAGGEQRVFRATRDGASGAVAAAPAAWPDRGPDLSATYRMPDPDDAHNQIGNARFTVWMQSRGHGSFDLMRGAATDAASGAEPVVLARGGWELEDLQFDARHSRVFYGTDSGIVAQDLATGAIRRIAGTGRHDQPLDFSSRWQLLLFQRGGACDAAAGDRAQAANLCLLHLPPP